MSFAPRWVAAAVFALSPVCLALQEASVSTPQVAAPEAGLAVHAPLAQISEYVRKVFQDRDGHLWFGTNDEGVARYDGRTLTFYGTHEGLAGQAIRGIVQDRAGALWFATDGGVSRFHNGTFTNYAVGEAPDDGNLWSMALDSSGTLWVGTHNGVRRFDGSSFVPFPLPRVEVERPESRFSPLVVFAMAEDRAGNLWFGTDGEGVHRYDGTTFTSFTTEQGLGGNQVRSVYADRRGRVWVGTVGGGVSCIDGGEIRTFTSKDGLGNDRVFGVLEDRAGSLWFSTLGAGVCRFDGETFQKFGAEHGLTRSHVQSLFEDADGVLWLGCSGGLFRFDGRASFINVTREGPWHAEPLEALSRLIGGRWKMTTLAGRDTYDTWTWGPGRHSIRSMRVGTLTEGEPWRTMTVYYWHPTLKEVRLLSVGSVWRGVGAGKVTFEGEKVESVFTLHQTVGPRNLRERWTFAGADTYHDELSEKVRDDYELLAEWDRHRVDAEQPAELVGNAVIAASPGPSELIRPLERALDHVWTTIAADGTDEPRSAGQLRTRTTFEYIPHADAIYGRVESINASGEASHAMDAYLYHDTGAGALRCLALSGFKGGDAVVYEGKIATAGDGRSIVLQFREHRASGETPLEVRLNFEDDGTVNQRVRTLEDPGRTIIPDLRHRGTRK